MQWYVGLIIWTLIGATGGALGILITEKIKSKNSKKKESEEQSDKQY